MNIYDIEATSLENSYNVLGNSLDEAYDLSGDIVWQKTEPQFFYAVHLDIGSKYISLNSIKTIIDSMETASDKITILQLDFSKNRGFRLALDNSTVTAADGYTYDLSSCYGNSTWDTNVDSNNNYWLTQSEMAEAISYAHSKNIDICPCFTMPGNMFAFLSPFSDFWYGSDKWGKTTLNFKSQRAVNFIVAVVEKYAEFFASCGCHYWNLGCDEVGTQTGSGIQNLYASGQFGILTDFVNLIAQTVKSKGLSPRSWNDAILWAGDTSPQYLINKSIQVCYWTRLQNTNMQYAITLAQNGYQLINSPNSMYYCPASSYPALNQTKFNNFVQNRTTFEEGSVVQNAIGCMWCIWFPNPKGITEANAISTIQTYLGYYGNAIEQYGTFTT